ncbi:hypothetical protein [Glycomyces xiaoerkulensis]|nr:hypothetical protein [Glycomyces xiaoerkulensis]
MADSFWWDLLLGVLAALLVSWPALNATLLIVRQRGAARAARCAATRSR